MTPEEKARQQIDRMLDAAGWKVQDLRELNLSAGLGVAVREFPLSSGEADYLLFVNRQARGHDAERRCRAVHQISHGRPRESSARSRTAPLWLREHRRRDVFPGPARS